MSQFKLDTTSGILLCKAKISNKGNSMFLKLAIDTGASITMIPFEGALAIGIDPSKSRRHLEITTANGVIVTPIITIYSFHCFGVEVKNMDVICHNLPPESAVGGLLGLNFLTATGVIIDFSKGTIETSL
jgi:predicted aspartyl protease